MTSIHSWLTQSKKHLSETTLVVLGNESADLDSMASSIVYGYLRSLQDPQTTVLPVMPIPRADFSLRTEAVYVFNEANIDLNDVVFFDEVDLDEIMEHAELVVVDHNKLAAGLERFSSQVVSILDHHIDEGLHPTASPRIIEPVGSTASLVAREFHTSRIEINRDIAVLLAGTILLDTVNLDDNAGRVTDTDREIAARILPLCPLSQQDFFDKVQKEKFNVTGLSTNDLLRKDYKEWKLGTVQCGIGSALLPIEDWSGIDNDLASGFAEFAANRNLDLLIAMNAYTNPGFNRELILFCKSKDAHDKLFNSLQTSGMGLTPIVFSKQKQNNRGFIGFYKQGNPGISRKKLQPLLADLYKEQ